MAEFGDLMPAEDVADSMDEEVRPPMSSRGLASSLFPMDHHFGDKINPLTEAIRNNDIRLLKELLEYGSDINGTTDVSFDCGVRTMQETPIVTSSRCGNLEATRLLVEKGCDLNEQAGCEHSTPIQIASNRGHGDVVKLLIEAGADVNYRGYLGFTAILEAVMENHMPIVQLLTENGAIINCRTSSDHSYDTLLMMAVVMDQDMIAEFLLKAGADVNMMNNGSTIPLAVALSEGKEALCNLLVLAGSKLRKKHLQAPHIRSNICLQHIKKARKGPLSLLELCRIAIRERFIHLGGGKSILRYIAQTQLPSFLKQYLSFEI